jgi:GNAT superfamily N-acetyltransferase
MSAMQVVDLRPEHESLFFRCLEDWNPETEAAATHRAGWFASFKQRGLRVKLALDDEGRPGGMIQYLPIEHAPALGHDHYYVLCIWVHGHPEGRGNFQGRGLGSALLAAAEDDARALGAKGMAAWGIVLPFWMRAAWFRKHGYRRADPRPRKPLEAVQRHSGRRATPKSTPSAEDRSSSFVA